MRVKQDDKVNTPSGQGVVKRIYYSKDSGKPYRAQVQVVNEILTFYIGELEVMG